MLMKSSTRGKVRNAATCGWGCCGTGAVRGKGKKIVRRSVKRAERNQWKKEI